MKKTIATVLALLALVGIFAGCAQQPASVSYVVKEEKLAAEEYGIGFRSGDIALGRAVADQLSAMIADGTAAKISKDWFAEDIVKDNPYLEDEAIPEGDDSLEKILQKGKLVMGLDASFPPMGFLNENNEIVGFDVDLAREVCKRLGVELVLQPINWAAKEMELNSGNIDCIWNGMSIDDGRLEAMFIPKAYLANAQVMIAGDSSSIQKISDMAGKKVGLQSGSTALSAVEKTEVFSRIGELVQYEDNVACYLDLKAGRIDVMVVDEVVGRYLIRTK